MSGPLFYYDLASPEAYLSAERVNSLLGVVPEWVPVRVGGPADVDRADIERRAHALGLQPVRWPEPFPADTEWAMLVATYAKQIGRAVAFSLAAFRQAFAAGRDLGELDTVLIAAAACELHPAAVVKGAELRSTRDRLQAATEAAVQAGATTVPAIRIGDRIFHDLEDAAGAIAA